MSTQLLSRWRTRLSYILLFLLTLFICTGLYLGSVVYRSKQLYKTESRWLGQPYRVHDYYGHFPKPYSLAYHSLKSGAPIPVIFDKNGFRIPYAQRDVRQLTALRLLFLGDSFTHGYGVPAEATFSYLTGAELNATAMNAGGSGWGLSQMVLRARDTIAQLEPDFVIVQYSSWLPDRSMAFYQSTQWGKSPAPYFFDSDDGLDIHQPVFSSIIPRLPISRFVGTNKDLFPFVRNIGIRLFAHDDYWTVRTALQHRLGRLPAPATSTQSVIDYTYKEIQTLCAVNGARMMIVVLPRSIDDGLANQLDAFSSQVVDVLEPLAESLQEKTARAWRTAYYFWGGNPPGIVDAHPNALMHAEIAKVLVEALRLSLPDGIESAADADAGTDVRRPGR